MSDTTPTDADDNLSVLLAAHTATDELIRLINKPTARTSNEDLLNRLDDFLEGSYDHKSEFRYPYAAFVRDNALDSWTELALFSGLGTVCVERVRPFDGTTARAAYATDSYAREMRHWSLWKNPGLSRVGDFVRQYHIAHAKQLFTDVTPAVRRRVASTLLVDDRYQRTTATGELPVSRVGSDYIHLDAEKYSLRCAATPRAHEDASDLPEIEIDADTAYIPFGLFERKLESYAEMCWAKIANVYYRFGHPRFVQRALDQCTQIQDKIRSTLGSLQHERVYGCCYGTTTSDTWAERDTVAHGWIAPDKRLINIVDSVRVHPEFGFEGYHTAAELYTAVSDTIPAPHRPSIALSSVEATKDVLDRGFDEAVTTRQSEDGEADVEYKLSEPNYTPLYAELSDCNQTHLWDAYLSVLDNQASYNLTTDPSDTSGSISGHVGVVEDDACLPTAAPKMATARKQAHRAAVTEPRQADSIHDVNLLANPDSIPEINRDEQLFLTRVSLAMAGLIKEYDLTESMRDFDSTLEGDQLNIDLEKLEAGGYLTKTSELKGVYYEVPYSVRRRLTVASISHESRPSTSGEEYSDPRYGSVTHEGYAEDHPNETTAHRVGVAQMATALEDTDGCDETIRYYDIHRLRPENIPLARLEPSAVTLTEETATSYGLDHIDTPTVADIPLDQLDQLTGNAGNTLGDVTLTDETVPRVSLADVGLDDLTLADLGLDEYRNRTLDVVGFDGGLLKHAVEVQRESGNQTATQRNFRKLESLDGLGAATHWHCPTIADLRCTMQHLNDPDYIDFEGFPNRKESTDRPSLWRRDLTTQDLWQPAIRSLSTHRSLEVTSQR